MSGQDKELRGNSRAGGNPPDSAPEHVADKMERIYSASQWRLMWWRFRKHRVAVISLCVLVALYAAAAFCEFLAPYPAHYMDPAARINAPPQRLHFFSHHGFHWRPFVYDLKESQDPETLAWTYTEDRERIYPVRFIVRGEPYRLWGLFRTRLHLFGVDKGGAIYLLGTDSLGQCLFSRILYGARVSLTIGLVGVALSFVLGLVIGTVSGYYGGWGDHVIQRTIEIIRSFPTIPLWMALSAALPRDWSALQVYFSITVILSLLGWTSLAREVRGKVLSLRTEDFAVAARLCGASERRVMFRHLLPSFMSHIIVSLTLTIPAMILGETALSFLGLGIRPPFTSWGVLLKEAQNVQAVASYPWLLAPVGFVVLTVLAFNFVGDGLRDAADPYAR